MRVYLLQSLVDNVAYSTEKVCLTEKIALKELVKFQRKNKYTTCRIQGSKVVEK